MSTTKKTKATNGHATVTAHASAATTTNPSSQPEPAAATAPAAASPATTSSAGSGTLGARIQNLLAVLQEIPALLGSPGSPATALSIEQRRGLPKMKTGADAQVPAVLALADKYGISIAGSGTSEARADMKLVTDLQPLETQLASALIIVGDAIAQAKARTWETTTTAYSTLKLRRYQKQFPSLQSELDPMASFMATKHKSAPTVLRQAEAKTLSKSRATLKEKKDKLAAAGAQGAAVTPSPAPSPAAAPAVNGGGTSAPAAHGAAAPAPEASQNGATPS